MIAFIIWFLITKNVAIAINILVTILVVACPCSLGLATPLAIVIASGNASKKGILVKTSEALENFHKAKTICFDKTGTLTKGTLSISKIYNYSNLEEKELLKNIASIEKKSEHPIARAIVNKAIEEKIEFEDKEFVGGKVIHNKEINRIQFLFDEKPNEEVRNNLKHNGFHWSRNEGAWQREFNERTIKVTNNLVKEMFEKEQPKETESFEFEEEEEM